MNTARWVVSTFRQQNRHERQLQENPLDLRPYKRHRRARALFDFIQRVYGPGDECSLWTPRQAEDLEYGKYWHVSWEAGPAEWGVLLSLGESMWLTEFELRHDHRPEVLLQSGPGWYSEPYHRFDIGFIEDEKPGLSWADVTEETACGNRWRFRVG